MIIIIDNQSRYIKQFRNDWLEESDIPYLLFDHNQPLWIDPKIDVKGIILSGGKGNPYQPLNLTANFVAMMRFDVPTIGLCLGHEIIAVAHGGRIKRLEEYQNRREQITLSEMDDPIFEGVESNSILLQKKHHFHVHQKPDSFITLGRSQICPHEIIKHKDKPIYGFQSHPEASGTVGFKIMENFFRLCGVLPQ